MSKECVADANIFIDFTSGHIFPALAHTGLTILTTDFIVDDMDAPALTDIEAAGVLVSSLDEVRVARLLDLTGRYRKPSLADLSALVLAEHHKTILLTGDGDLRSAAADLGVEVHGTIWVLDRLVRSDALSKNTAATALANMINSGRRLPALVVKKRLADWKA